MGEWPPRFTVDPGDALAICVRMAASRPAKGEECVAAARDTLTQCTEALRATNARLREALAWYALPGHDIDNGAVARAALNETKGAK